MALSAVVASLVPISSTPCKPAFDLANDAKNSLSVNAMVGYRHPLDWPIAPANVPKAPRRGKQTVLSFVQQSHLRSA